MRRHAFGDTPLNLADLAAPGSAIGGFAIPVSLVYLGLQMRQSGKNQRALMQQGRVARISSAAEAFAVPEIAEAVDRCWDGFVKVSAVRLRQFAYVCRQLVISAEDSFLQHRDGLLTDAACTSLVASMTAYLTSPGVRPCGSSRATGTSRDSACFSTGSCRRRR